MATWLCCFGFVNIMAESMLGNKASTFQQPRRWGGGRTKERDRTEPLPSAFLNLRPPMRPHLVRSAISASTIPWALESSLNRHSNVKSTTITDRCYSSLNTPRPNYEHKIEILTSASVFSKAAQTVTLSYSVRHHCIILNKQSPVMYPISANTRKDVSALYRLSQNICE